MENNKNYSVLTLLLSIVAVVLGIVLAYFFWDDNARVIYKLALNNDFSPSSFVLFSSLFLFGVCLLFVILSYKLKDIRILPLSIFFATLGVANLAYWLVNDRRIDRKKPELIIENSYSLIGEIEGRALSGNGRVNLILYGKTIGDKLYYCCKVKGRNEDEYYLVHWRSNNQGEISIEDRTYYFTMNFEWSKKTSTDTYYYRPDY